MPIMEGRGSESSVKTNCVAMVLMKLKVVLTMSKLTVMLVPVNLADFSKMGMR